MTASLQFPSRTPMTAPPRPQLNDHVTMQGMDVEHNLHIYIYIYIYA